MPKVMIILISKKKGQGGEYVLKQLREFLQKF